MKLSDYMRERELDDEKVSLASGGQFSPEAVRKWRYGQRMPRPAQLRALAEITGGLVTANDFIIDPPTPTEAHA